MYIRSLPHSRPSRNRRRSGRWIRCAILDRKWVHPRATIGLYLLDDKRRETARARDHAGQPIALTPQDREIDLIRAIRPFGEGRYRLVARNRKGHILARRDFVAAVFAWDLDSPEHAPRTEIERLKAELATARETAESLRAERDAARAEAEALKRGVAERDAEITGLESALDRQGQALRRARRLYAELSDAGPRRRDGEPPSAGEASDAEGEDTERERAAAKAPPSAAADGEDPEPAGGDDPAAFGLKSGEIRAEVRRIYGFVEDIFCGGGTDDSSDDTDPTHEQGEPASEGAS